MLDNQKEYLPRHMDAMLKEYLELYPVVLVEGAKSVGKTSTCKNLSRTVFYLDAENHFDIISSAPEIILKSDPTVLIDEWQKYPPIWERARRMVDEGMPVGTLLMTGSSPSIASQLHSGSGRIVKLKMRPFTIEERKMSEQFISLTGLAKIERLEPERIDYALEDYLDEIFKSGIPGIRDLAEKARKGMLEGYVENIITREFEENGFVIRRSDALRKWLRSYAAAIGTVTDFQTILETASKDEGDMPARQTVANYREALITLGIIEELPSWPDFGKLFPALSRSSKHFLLDPALIAPLLAVSKEKLMKGEAPHPIGKLNKSFFGRVFESFVYQSLATYAEVKHLSLSHLRLQKGNREIDFILEDAENNQLFTIEVKSNVSVQNDDVKHLNWFYELAKEEFKITRIVIYMGEFAYTRKDGVHVIPAAMLGI